MFQRGHQGSSSGPAGTARQAATSKGNSSSCNKATQLPTRVTAATHTQPLCRSSSTAAAAWSTAGRSQPHENDPRVNSSRGKDPIVWLYGDVDLHMYDTGVSTAGDSGRSAALDTSDLQDAGGLMRGQGGKEEYSAARRGLFRYGSLPASAVRQLLMYDHEDDKYGSHDDMEYDVCSRDDEDDTARAPDRLVFHTRGVGRTEATDGSGAGFRDAPRRSVRTSSGKAAGATREAELEQQGRASTGSQEQRQRHTPLAGSAAARLRHRHAQEQLRLAQQGPDGGDLPVELSASTRHTVRRTSASPQGPSTPTAGSNPDPSSSSQGNPADTFTGAWSSGGSSSTTTTTSSDEYDSTSDTASVGFRSTTSPASTPTAALASAFSPTAALPPVAVQLPPAAAAHAPPHLVRLRPTEPPVPRPPPDVRYYTDGRTASYRVSLPYKLLAQATLAAYVGWPYALVGLAVGAAVWGSGLCVALLLVLAATVALPAPPRPWEAFLGLPLFR